MLLGLVVNPIAGMGGRFALKGSDDPELLAAARERGASPVAPQRAVEALRSLAPVRERLKLTYPGEMGETEARAAGLEPVVVGSIGAVTSSADTRAAVCAMAERGVDLLLFAGGDGTAVDVLEAIGDRLPVLGVPAGVKMHSAVFAVNPKSAGGASHYASSTVPFATSARPRSWTSTRRSWWRLVSARLHGYLKVPVEPRLVQGAKTRSLAGELAAQEGIANHLVEHVLDDRTWFVGPGTTTRAVLQTLGLEKTLLGVDVIRDGRLLVADADEQTLLEVAAAGEAGIVVTPVGGQGFLFGRGNQQLSAPVFERVGRDRIVVIATEVKIAALGGAPLRVDTGDAALDESLSGYMRVIVAHNREIVYRIAP